MSADRNAGMKATFGAFPVMEEDEGGVLGMPRLDPNRTHWVRARTLRNLRWIAVIGQLITVLVVHYALGFELPLAACLAAISAATWFNIVAASILPPNARLSEKTALAWLLFDAMQLAILLALTGGLSNPFALLFIAPTTIAAAALTQGSARIAVTICVVLICLLELMHLPLLTDAGTKLELPALYRLGVWCALLVGVSFIAIYVRRVADEAFNMSQALAATQLALAREQRLAEMGAMAAAAAHELGTPLATIALTAKELERDLPAGSEAAEDTALIREQTARCRDILAEFAAIRKSDMEHVRSAPILSVIEEAAAPHRTVGKRIAYTFDGLPVEADAAWSPDIERRPELIHGVRNLIQNAVDFARSDVFIDVAVTNRAVRVRIQDDGPGYPPETLDRIGEPFLTTRRGRRAREGGYEGMGLGLFIAKTLLERRGAELSFFNQGPTVARPAGAAVEIIWPAAALLMESTADD